MFTTLPRRPHRTCDLIRALRDAGVPVIGGFHSPMEKKCLELLLRGRQPVVVCPARGIDGMRLPGTQQLALALLAAGKRLFVLVHEDHRPLLEAGAITIDAESAMRVLERARTHLPMR